MCHTPGATGLARQQHPTPPFGPVNAGRVFADGEDVCAAGLQGPTGGHGAGLGRPAAGGGARGGWCVVAVFRGLARGVRPAPWASQRRAQPLGRAGPRGSCARALAWLRGLCAGFPRRVLPHPVCHAEQHAKHADLALCLGTSLQIRPACNIPLRTIRVYKDRPQRAWGA